MRARSSNSGPTRGDRGQLRGGARQILRPIDPRNHSLHERSDHTEHEENATLAKDSQIEIEPHQEEIPDDPELGIHARERSEAGRQEPGVKVWCDKAEQGWPQHDPAAHFPHFRGLTDEAGCVRPS